MIDLNQFVEWAREGEARRTVDMKIGDPLNKEYLLIYVYDYDLGVGQMVKSVDEIDLEGKYAEEEKKEFERLLAKYGQEGKNNG